MKRLLPRLRLAATIRSDARRLAEDRSGATIVEFAFIAGPLMALLVAILQTTMAFFAQQNIDSTAEVATRALMTGSAQQGKKTAAQFKTDVCAQLASFMNCSNVMVDVRTAANFSDADTSTPNVTFNKDGTVSNSWQFTPGGPGQITIARVMYIWDVQKAPFGFDLSTMSNGKRLLVSTAVFKTEPYQ